MIAKRDYEDFVSALHDLDVMDDPILVTQEVVGSDRKCCVPGCEAGVSCGLILEPYKNPGRAWVCVHHGEAVNKVLQRLNGLRVLRELEPEPRTTDPDRRKRINAIKQACLKHNRERDYIGSVCNELQHSRIQMLPGWLNTWGKKGFRVEATDWIYAYKSNPAAKLTIQKYISKYAKCRTNPANS